MLIMTYSTIRDPKSTSEEFTKKQSNIHRGCVPYLWKPKAVLSAGRNKAGCKSFLLGLPENFF
jgi:hypothetical protein